MTHGAGKYDELATYARKQANASAVILIIMDGNKGSGFSVQVVEQGLLLPLPGLLRELADDIDRDLFEGKTQ